MDRFQEMKTFTAVAEAGSFVAASDLLALSKAAVSRQVSELEARLGVRLLHRTTRRLSLTDEGQIFLERCRSVMAELEEAESEITARSGQASGQLRVSAPVTFGHLHLQPLWGAFMQANPQVRLDVTLSDRVVDLVEEGFDVAVRIARLPSSSLISRKLASTRLVLCASPRYLRHHGKPRTLSDLRHHQVLAYSLSPTPEVFELQGPQGIESVRIVPALRTNSGDVCRAAALAHQGIVMQPTFLVGDDLKAGTLVQVLPQYPPQELGIYAVYPSRRHVAPKVRVLIDFLAQALRRPVWDDRQPVLNV